MGFRGLFKVLLLFQCEIVYSLYDVVHRKLHGYAQEVKNATKYVNFVTLTCLHSLHYACTNQDAIR